MERSTISTPVEERANEDTWYEMQMTAEGGLIVLSGQCRGCPLEFVDKMATTVVWDEQEVL